MSLVTKIAKGIGIAGIGVLSLVGCKNSSYDTVRPIGQAYEFDIDGDGDLDTIIMTKKDVLRYKFFKQPPKGSVFVNWGGGYFVFGEFGDEE